MRKEYKEKILCICKENDINRISPSKAIRKKCLDCCAGDTREVLECEVIKCPIWPFRFGGNPWSSKNMSEEHKEKLRISIKERFNKKGDN